MSNSAIEGRLILPKSDAATFIIDCWARQDRDLPDLIEPIQLSVGTYCCSGSCTGFCAAFRSWHWPVVVNGVSCRDRRAVSGGHCRVVVACRRCL